MTKPSWLGAVLVGIGVNVSANNEYPSHSNEIYHAEEFAEIDLNNNHTLERAEVQRAQQAQKYTFSIRFADMDADANHEVTLDEWLDHVTAPEAVDAP